MTTELNIDVPVGAEAVAVLEGVVQYLRTAGTDCGTRVYDNVAEPSETQYPVCTVSLYDAVDTNTTEGYRVLVSVSLLVRVIAPMTNIGGLSQVASQMDTAIRDLAVSGHTFAVVRDRPVADAVTEEGTTFRIVGGVYTATVA